MMSSRLGPQAHWIEAHVADCPRCRRRLASWGKVNLAFSFIKAQPHGLDLLMRANTQAIGVLKHGLQAEPKAQELRTSLPCLGHWERCGKYGHCVGSLAACVTILLLMKVGVFSSMDTVQAQGQKVIKQYYAKQVGQDLADEVFPTPSTPLGASSAQSGRSAGSSGNPRHIATV
jgi:anti-sigma factor RsiW